jgi:DNA modification methylase
LTKASLAKNKAKTAHPDPYYETSMGIAYCGDALELMGSLPDNSVNLIMTSPPFALIRKKSYDNINARGYIHWFLPFAQKFYRVLRSDGSLVIDIGGSWENGKPVKSLHVFELLVRLCKDIGFYLAQDLYWFNRGKLPTPAQWVTIKRCRLKDAVDHLWWLSKTPYPKANNRNVLVDYSRSMKKLLQNSNYYKPNVKRPSEHVISKNFFRDNAGAIPSNLLDFSNTKSRSRYLTMCKEHKKNPHPARYPVELPMFFIRFLTDEGDLVLDPFGGSNTTGEAAEKLGRKWIMFEAVPEYLESSKFRFDNLTDHNS